MQAIAYAASIGGMATLIGTPPNLVLAGVIKKMPMALKLVFWIGFYLLFLSPCYFSFCAGFISAKLLTDLMRKLSPAEKLKSVIG